MEMMKKMFECMAGEMGEKEKDETTCSPDMNRATGCCPGMMEQYFSKMRNCVEEKGRGSADGEEKKPEGTKCC